jgi:hypothetical protein
MPDLISSSGERYPEGPTALYLKPKSISEFAKHAKMTATRTRLQTVCVDLLKIKIISNLNA